MTVHTTPLKDCYLLELPKFGDERGFFMEAFNRKKLQDNAIDFDIHQVNFASSQKNVLRGLHYQDAPYAQAKLVGVTRGSVMDVVVDIRKDSPSYLKHYKVRLDRSNILLLVPKGFAHGYQALEDDTLFYYFVDAPYAPEFEKGVRYDDPALAIDWGLDETPIVSQKDLKQPLLKDVVNQF